MRRSVVWSLPAATGLGAVLAALSVGAGFWRLRDRPITVFEAVPYGELGDAGPYDSVTSITLDTDWVAALTPSVVAGAVAGFVVGFVLYRLVRRTVVLLAGSAVLGAAVGLIGVAATYGWYKYETSGDGFDRIYVDYLPEPVVSDWTALLLPAAVTGAVLGLVFGAAAYAVARRSARRAARSA